MGTHILFFISLYHFLNGGSLREGSENHLYTTKKHTTTCAQISDDHKI